MQGGVHAVISTARRYVITGLHKGLNWNSMLLYRLFLARNINTYVKGWSDAQHEFWCRSPLPKAAYTDARVHDHFTDFRVPEISYE